jgi:hypothetical protein
VAAEQGRERWRRDVTWTMGQPVALTVIAHELQVVQAHPHHRLALPRNRCALPEADYRRLETALAGHWVPSTDEPRMPQPRVLPAWRH